MALSQYGIQSWRQARGTENPGWYRPVPAPRPQGRIPGRVAATAPRRLAGRVPPLDLGLHRPDALGLFLLPKFVPKITHATPRADRRQG
jgi:hypothetical protein